MRVWREQPLVRSSSEEIIKMEATIHWPRSIGHDPLATIHWPRSIGRDPLATNNRPRLTPPVRDDSPAAWTSQRSSASRATSGPTQRTTSLARSAQHSASIRSRSFGACQQPGAQEVHAETKPQSETNRKNKRASPGVTWRGSYSRR